VLQESGVIYSSESCVKAPRWRHRTIWDEAFHSFSNEHDSLGYGGNIANANNARRPYDLTSDSWHCKFFIPPNWNDVGLPEREIFGI
jgi:hypothetical protein